MNGTVTPASVVVSATSDGGLCGSYGRNPLWNGSVDL
jgi:hypothetical protein